MGFRHVFTAFSLLASLSCFAEKSRLIVLTDIGGDPDDTQSMVRLMTYANEFDIEGLIASASGTPGELKENVVRPDLIRQVVYAYGQVRHNLSRHAAGYPAERQLLAVIKAGNSRRGVDSIGEGRDTEGSNWIISVVDRADSRPVDIAIWGGATELAQALWRVRENRAPSDVDGFLNRIRVHSIGHQDNTGPWILENFPPLFFILSSSNPSYALGEPRKGPDSRLSVYRGMYLGGDESLTSLTWIDEHVRRNHGPLGALYPPKTWTAPNPNSALKEGDTPSWFYFLPHGLNDPDHPEWGGWGGRFREVRKHHYNDAQDRLGDVHDARATVWRWRQAFQNDFAARMDWCVQPDKRKANHNPLAVLQGDRSRNIVYVSARSGDQVRLSANGSRDPDGGRVAHRWFLYSEAGDYEGAIDFEDASRETLVFTPPRLSTPASLHVVLEVTDTGAPALYSYRRAVVKVTP